MHYTLTRFTHFIFAVAFFLFVFTGDGYSQQAAPTAIPPADHIVIVIMENHGYAQIIGASSAPHINAIANDDHSALFTQSFAIEHPSQPNYLDLFAGCNQGVTDDSKPTAIPFTTDNLGRQLIDAGKTFITYSEDLPSVGYNGSSSGAYARKHNPAANWMGTGTNQIPTTTNQPFTAFPTDFTTLPTVCVVVPNQNNDMHNGGDPTSIINGDNWVYNNLNNYLQWTKTHNSLLILTFDEDDASANNHIVTIFAGQIIRPGKYSETINHYTILRTIEEMYGLRYVCNASAATAITDVWSDPAGVIKNEFIAKDISISPNPTTGIVIVQNQSKNITHLSISNILGQKMLDVVNTNQQEFTLDLTKFPAGTYIARFVTSSGVVSKKIIRE